MTSYQQYQRENSENSFTVDTTYSILSPPHSPLVSGDSTPTTLSPTQSLLNNLFYTRIKENSKIRRNSYTVHEKKRDSIVNQKRRNSEPHSDIIRRIVRIEHRFSTPPKRSFHNSSPSPLSPTMNYEQHDVHSNEVERLKIAFDYSSEIVKENIFLNEEIRVLKEKLYSRKDKKNIKIEKLKIEIIELKKINDDYSNEIKMLKNVNGTRTDSFIKLKKKVSFLNNEEGFYANEGDLLLKYKHIKREMSIIKKEKDEFRKYFKVMSKRNKKCRKIIGKLKKTIHRLKGDDKWDEKGIKRKKTGGIRRTESDEILMQRVKVVPRKLSNVLSDSNIVEAIKNSRKEMSFEKVKQIREELANLRNINFLLLTNVNHLINENQVFTEKFKKVLPILSRVSLLADKNKWEYSQIQMKIIQDLGILNLYTKNVSELSPAKEGYLRQKQRIGWKKVYVLIVAKQNSLSVYSSEEKKKLLYRESLHGNKITEKGSFEFKIKLTNAKEIFFRCEKSDDTMQWIGFLDSLCKLNSN